jgi:hypothetical protein
LELNEARGDVHDRSWSRRRERSRETPLYCREVAMIVQFIDSVMGTPVYVNPAYVVTLRPDPADPDHISIIKIRDGESIRVRGGDKEVADKLARAV